MAPFWTVFVTVSVPPRDAVSLGAIARAAGSIHETFVSEA
jgi:hypothetical protein